MILGLFPLKPADKIVCFDLIFYVFFFLTSILSHIGPNQTVSAHIGPNRVLFQTVLDRIGPRWKKKKFVHGRTTHPRKSNSGVPAKSAHWCFLGVLFVAASTVPPQICIQEPDYPTTTVPQ